MKANPPPTCNPGSPYQPVALVTYQETGPNHADPNKILSIEMQIREHPLDYPGVVVDTKAVRTYPQDGAVPGTTLAAQTLGHLGPISQYDFKTAKGTAGPYLGEQNLLTTTEVDADNKVTTADRQEDVGRGGLEQQYDAELRGLDGDQTLTVNSSGNVDGTVKQTLPLQGDDLVLNLDDKIQKAAEAALQHGLALTHQYGDQYGDAGDGAAAVVMTTDGRIVALASTPSFDETAFESPATYSKLINDPLTPLNNRASTGIYPPGSSFKPITSAAVLADGIATADQYLPCQNTITVGNRTVHNFEGEDPGGGDLAHELEVSCDTYFASVGADQWGLDGGLRQTPYEKSKPAHEYLAKMAEAFGFGKSVGVDIPEGSPGLVVDRAEEQKIYAANKASYCKGAKDPKLGAYVRAIEEDNCVSGNVYREGDAAYFAIGQGANLEVTPLQMARAYAAIANGGTLYAPTLGKALVRPEDGSVEKMITPTNQGKVPVPESDLLAIENGMYQVTHGSSGTAERVFGKYPISVCGKTGTAEVQAADKNGNPLPPTDTSWFGSFAPCAADGSVKPKYVVMAVIPQSNQGAEIAAPVVQDIYNAIYQIDPTTMKVGNKDGATAGALPCFKANGEIVAPNKDCLHPTAPPLATLQQLAPVTPASAPPGLTPSPVADLPSARPTTKAKPKTTSTAKP